MKCDYCKKDMKEGKFYKATNRFGSTKNIECKKDEYYYCTCGCEIIHVDLMRRIEKYENGEE